MDFLYGFVCKCLPQLDLRAGKSRTQPHVGDFCSLLLGPFRPSSIAFEMPDSWAIFLASSLHRPDLSLSAVSLTPFYLLSARLDQDDVAYAEAKLPQTTTNILPAWPGDREFVCLFFASRKGLCVYRCVASRKGALLLLFSSLPLLSSSLLLF